MSLSPIHYRLTIQPSQHNPPAPAGFSLEHRMKLFAWLSLALMLAAGAPETRADDQAPGTPAYRAFYGSFLPPTCCWTNGCCRRAKPGEVEALDDRLTRFRVVASGQEIERSAWSPDGAFHICQCDWEGGGWKTGPATNARCLAVPAPTG